MPQAVAPRVAGPLLPLLLAVGLLYLGAPRTIAAFVSLPGDNLLGEIQVGESLSATNLEILIISRERALAWVEAGRVQTDLAFAQQVLAKASGEDGAYDQAGVARAIESLRAGLARAPARPYAWTRLASARSVWTRPASTHAARARSREMINVSRFLVLTLSRFWICSSG